MTAKKDFKRLVQARARKTGESYAAALRHFRAARDAVESGEESRRSNRALPPRRRIEKPDLGFAVLIPDDWAEQPADPFNSPLEVARFVYPATPVEGKELVQAVLRNCLVFRRALPRQSPLALGASGMVRPGLHARALAWEAQQLVARRGVFGNFRLRDAVMAGQPAARLDFDRPWPRGRVWAVRQYFVVASDQSLCIAWGTTAPEQDKALIDTMAAGFELIGSAEVGSGSGGRMEAGGAPTPDGGGEQPTPPQIDWEMRERLRPFSTLAHRVVLAAHAEAFRRGTPAIEPAHLLFGIAVVPGSAALAILEDLRVPAEQLRVACEAALAGEARTPSGDPSGPGSGHILLSDEAKAVLVLAEEEAHAREQTIVSAHDLLMGMLRRREGRASTVLSSLGVTLDGVQHALQQYLET